MTAIEFAFVGFIFIVLLLGAVDLSRYQFTQQSLRDVTAEAARVALVNINKALDLNSTATPACPSGDSLKSAVANLTPFLTPAQLDFTSTPPTCIPDANASGVRTITVTASYRFQFIAPLLPSTMPPLTAKAAISY